VRPLAGQRILLTRAEEDSAAWAEQLSALGAVGIVFPCIRRETLVTDSLRQALASAMTDAAWLVLTSRRGVAALAALYERPVPPSVRVAVVGPSTAEAASAMLGRVDLIGAGATAASLAETLRERHGAELRGALAVLALAENAGDTLERRLAPLGVRCRRFDVYRTVPAPPATPKRALSTLGADNVFLASPSAVTGFVHQVEIDAGTPIFTIGPSTTAAARAGGLAVTAQAREPSLKGLVEAMQCVN
jgi:uroporphyrinogen-III synthase